MTTTLVKAFARISRTIGADPAHVQGGGGNTSVKLDDRRMAIKASGVRLDGVTESGGFAVVDHRAIADRLRAGEIDDAGFARSIQEAVLEPGSRPSIETGLHALLGRFVIHTHPVYVNVLTCAEEGERLSARIWPGRVWVPYAAPGRGLVHALRQAAAGSSAGAPIFLQSHGLIVAGETEAAVLALHEEVNARCRDAVCAGEFVADAGASDLEALGGEALFPDQIVYAEPGADRATRAAVETAAARRFILETLRRAGLAPRFLAPHEVDAVRNMEAERYRRALAAGAQ